MHAIALVRGAHADDLASLQLGAVLKVRQNVVSLPIMTSTVSLKSITHRKSEAARKPGSVIDCHLSSNSVT